jgi:hypothetical protein
MASTPNTLSIGQAISNYCAALTYPSTALVYTKTQLGAIKDITDFTVNSLQACLEIYAHKDDSQHHAFNGKIVDTQTWLLLSLVNMNDTQTAETTIYYTRDALMVPFQTHATLGNASSVFNSKIKPNGAQFVRLFRNGQWYRGHLLELETMQEWFIAPPGVVS